ncbi:MAG TPA: Uma2 family endonuclease [Beijerinckia sp.]|nr:Uma2 family endonuclease [Beijerinckia sp.]
MDCPSSHYECMSLDDFEEFLADKPNDQHWELIGGRLARMLAGSRWEHHYIAQNLGASLREQLRQARAPCKVFVESFFLKDKATESATLPDVMVYCGPLPSGATFVSNPIVVAQVLSPGNEARDRMEKWNLYQRMPSLRHFVLIARDRPRIEVFDRFKAKWSGPRILEGLNAFLELPAIDTPVSLREIYRDVISA